MGKTLLPAKNLYKIIMENVGDTVFITDFKENFNYISENAKDVFQFDNGQLDLGGNINKFFGKNIVNINLLKIYKQINNLEFNYTDKFGIKQYFLVNVKIISFDQKIILYCFKNITELIMKNKSKKNKIRELENKIRKASKVLNDTIERDKVRTEFFANLAHEFRTPLNLIFSSMQLCNMIMKRDYSSQARKLDKYVNVINQNCYRLMRLINNMIDITKIDAGFLDLNLNNYNIVNVIENITLSVVEYVRNKGINLIFDTNVEEKIMACDADKIERIILNLISNAIKFTGQGGYLYVTVTDKGEKVNVSVRDTGIGIPKEKLKLIFKRFVQVNKPCERKHTGSGIGLNLVKSLVEMHNGTINVNSVVGKGTEFIIELPAKIIDNKKVVSDVECNYEDKIDRINVEFSDIYL